MEGGNEMVCQNLLLNFQAGAVHGRVMGGGTKAVTKLSFPVFSLSS